MWLHSTFLNKLLNLPQWDMRHLPHAINNANEPIAHCSQSLVLKEVRSKRITLLPELVQRGSIKFIFPEIVNDEDKWNTTLKKVSWKKEKGTMIILFRKLLLIEKYAKIYAFLTSLKGNEWLINLFSWP